MTTGKHKAAASPQYDIASWARYAADATWRWIETLDTLRQRADDMQEHAAAGMPPLLHFEGEQIADARTFDPPCNYRLLRITSCPHGMERHVRGGAVPVLVVDPRAGHGPGIGGFRRDSEVGMAMLEGHPTYFAVFDPEPVPGQTLSAVLDALARFVDIVAQRHRKLAPIVYGNCQGGWAIAMALSHCDRQATLAVLNGSPLSYWAGDADANPMRLAGGLLGGAWLAHLTADLGNGRFDGAWLVQNFENLRPEEIWKKYRQVFAQPERERERFLEFERWWSGFYQLSREEMLSIVRDLFIGNRVELGEVRVNQDRCAADLTQLRTPLLIFCSKGDNITPPAQALGWLKTAFGSTEALVRAGQRIVYLQHEHVGHLGIFVSAAVALREHRAILHHAAAIGALAPGLYEMKLQDEPGKGDAPARARFEPRAIEELPFEARPEQFGRVAELSVRLDELYSKWLSPLVRSLSNEETAKWMRLWHPMRSSRLMWSGRYWPAMAVVPLWSQALRAAGWCDEQREANPWYRLEALAADGVTTSIESARRARDRGSEWAFQRLYDAPEPAAGATTARA
ncbi:MAG: DUF3141 domain-containing protein [Rubrivivax sp.]|nr:DUF3141 domain-containing protein [Rubrivivax sp.]